MREFTCIICPRGCSLKVDDNGNVTGNFCPRGKEYAINEITNPKRTITTTIRVKNRKDTVVSVKTTCAVPKGMIFQVMAANQKLSSAAAPLTLTSRNSGIVRFASPVSTLPGPNSITVSAPASTARRRHPSQRTEPET